MKISKLHPTLLKFTPIALLAIFAACANPPEYPLEPEIEYIAVTKDTLKRRLFSDTTTVVFSFTDGDGDIGSDDSLALFIYDPRLESTTRFLIPFVPELGASNGIKGEISFDYFSTCCVFEDTFIDPCFGTDPEMPYDQVQFDIFIKDRAGNQSNTITTDPIFIECFN